MSNLFSQSAINLTVIHENRPLCNDWHKTSALLTEFLSGIEDREAFVVVALDSKCRCIAISCVHLGTISACMVGPREVFRTALMLNASQIIVSHNHPSGDTSPSAEDLAITKKLVSLGKQLDVPVIDHIIIGAHHSHSIRQNNPLLF